VEKVDILAIGGHAGDAEISCGMALCRHFRQGKRVAMLHCTLGERGHPTLNAAEYAKQKRAEAEKAAAVLNAPVYFLPYKDGELPVDEVVKFAICDVIRECRPDVVLTHWRGSMHKDHTNTHLNLPDAIFYAALKTIERDRPNHWARTLLYAENWEDPYGFTPEVYLEITEEDMALWEQMATQYSLFRGEWKTFSSVEYYRALAKVRGLEVFASYATAFAVPENSRRRKVTTLLSPP
jgi:LmbE family N-acetylglucosaminyl deacetylase